MSIITSLYNSEAYIAQTIESVLAQTYTDWEMIITDDGSVDNSTSIVESYSAKDQRIRLLRLNANGGPGIARNNSISNEKRIKCTCFSWCCNWIRTWII